MSVGQAFGSSSVELFWLTVSHEVMVKMRARATVLWLDWPGAGEPLLRWSSTGLEVDAGY